MAGGWVGGLKKVGDVYHCRVRHRGQEIHKSTGESNPEAAKRWLRRFLDAMDAIADGRAPAPSVEELLRLWKADHAKVLSAGHVTGTVDNLTKHVLPYIGEATVDKVSTADITIIRREYLAGCGPTGRPHTIAGANLLLRQIRLLFNYAVDQELIASIPWSVAKIKEQRKPKVTLPEELIPAFLTEIKKARNPEVPLAVMGMLFLCLRESEALQMRWDLFSPDGKVFTPGKWFEDTGFRTKGGEAVALPVHPELWALIEGLKQKQGMPLCPWVMAWRGEDGIMRPHVAHFATKAIRRAGEAVGVKGLTPHRLRGTGATILARQGVDPFVIQRILRHKDINTTLIYVEVGRSNMEDALNGLWAANGGGVGPKVGLNIVPFVTKPRPA